MEAKPIPVRPAGPGRALLVGAALACGLALGACGGGDDGVSDEDRQAIEAVIEQSQAVAVSKDAGAFCDLLQPSSFREVFNTRARCVKEFSQVLETSPGPPRGVEIADVEVDGDQATVTFDPAAAPAILVKEKGEWYLPLPDPDATVTDGA